MQQAVVLYEPLPQRIRNTKKNQALAKFVKIAKKLKDSGNVERGKN